MPGRSVRSLACGLLFGFAVLSAPAFAAVDPDRIGAALVAAIAATGEATLTFGSAAASADGVTLSDVKIATARNGYTAAVPTLAISGVVERPEGGFTATGMRFDGGTATLLGNTVTWKTGTLQAVIVPSEAEAKARARLSVFRQLALAGLTMTGPTLPAPIVADTATLDLGDVAASATTAVQGKASGVHLPTSLLSNSFLGAIVSQLDYKEFVAEITLDALHNSATDSIVLNTATLDAAGAGKISLSGKASGISVKGMADPDKSKEARASARLDNAVLRVDNAGFVDRVLELQGSMLGMSREDVSAAWVDGVLPVALSVVKNEAFRTQFLSAIRTFLQEPKSLTFTVAPAGPLPLGQVARTAARSPTALPDLLAPTVEANN